MKNRRWLILFILFSMAFAGTALAHKVNIFAYVEGGKVFTESYFPDGRPVEGGKVMVYDSQDNLLIEGKTDQQGLFSFSVPKIDALTILLEAAMGHKAAFKLSKADVEAGK